MNIKKWYPTDGVFILSLMLSCIVHLMIFILLDVPILDTSTTKNTSNTPLAINIIVERKKTIKTDKIAEIKVITVIKSPEKIVIAQKKVSKPKIIKVVTSSSKVERRLPPIADLVRQAATFASPNINSTHVLVDTSKNMGVYYNYINSWRAKVKRIGEIYFSNQTEGQLVIIAEIQSDGSLLGVEIIRKSSKEQLNKDIVNIVKAGTPYAKFPKSFNGIATLRIKTIIAFRDIN